MKNHVRVHPWGKKIWETLVCRQAVEGRYYPVICLKTITKTWKPVSKVSRPKCESTTSQIRRSKNQPADSDIRHMTSKTPALCKIYVFWNLTLRRLLNTGFPFMVSRDVRKDAGSLSDKSAVLWDSIKGTPIVTGVSNEGRDKQSQKRVSSALTLEDSCNLHQSTLPIIQEDLNLRQHRCKNLKSHVFVPCTCHASAQRFLFSPVKPKLFQC
jgi:hypothetical protein